MDVSGNDKLLDIGSLSWGESPVPLLPGTLREEWRDEQLPSWAQVELGLSSTATFYDLGQEAWQQSQALTPRIRNMLILLIRSRVQGIAEIPCFHRTWPLGLNPDQIRYSARTRGAVQRAGLFDDLTSLSRITFGHLTIVPGMGAQSVLEFVTLSEAAMDQFDSLVTRHMGSLKQAPSAEISDLETALEEDWVIQITRADPRFAKTLPLGHPILAQAIDDVLSDPDSLRSVAEVPRLLELVDKTREIVRVIDNCTLDEGLIELLRHVSRLDGERLDALAARMGWLDGSAITLEEAGQRLGVTRERIRQIQKKATNRLPAHPVYLPQLDAALRLIELKAPISKAEAAQLLHKEGITSVPFDPAGLLSAAECLHRETSLVATVAAGTELIVNEPARKAVARIATLARRLAGKSGVANTLMVIDKLEEEDLVADQETVRRTIEELPELQFLDEDWFWATDLPRNRNRLVNVTNRMLSAVSPQTVHGLREGARRNYRWRASSTPRLHDLVLPPILVMQRFYEQHPDYEVDESNVRPVIPLDYKRELGDAERTFVEVLRSSPSGVLDRRSLAEGCLSRGMLENTFNVFSTYSCILEHVTLDVWKLRGAHVDPASIEALRAQSSLRPREKRVLDHGWSTDGLLWIAVRVPALTGSLVIGVPGAIRRYVEGREYAAHAAVDNRPCGTIVVKDDGASYGYGKFVRRYGADCNDVLMIEFDLTANTVALSITDDQDLDSEL